MSNPFSITEVPVIRYGKTTWVPDVKDVNGIRFICLSKWCRSFVHFTTGKALDFRKHKSFSANVEFFDKLVQARKRAAASAITDSLTDLDVDAPTDGRRTKKRKVTWQELCSSEMMGPPFVTINIDGHEMRVLSELRSSFLWVEFSESNLAFIRQGVEDALGSQSAGRSWAGRKSAACDRGDGSDDNINGDDDDADEEVS
jgi:hypothetical protein